MESLCSLRSKPSARLHPRLTSKFSMMAASINKHSTGMSLDERFTLIRSVTQNSPNRNNSRGRGVNNRMRSRSSLKNRQLVQQMENRPTVQAALKTKFKPALQGIKQRLNLPNKNFRLQRSNSVNNLTIIPLKRANSITNLNRQDTRQSRSAVRGRGRGGLRRSNSMSSLNRANRGRSQERGASVGPRSNNLPTRGPGRPRKNSVVHQRNFNVATGNRVSGGAVTKPGRMIRRASTGGQRGRNRGGNIAARRASGNFIANTPIKMTQYRRNNNLRGGQRAALDKSGGAMSVRGGAVRGRGGALRGRGGVVRGRGGALRGRGGSTRGGGSQRSRGGAVIGRGAVKGRRGGALAGRGGLKRTASNPVPSKEELDSQLDQYMAGTKAHLDRELDTYMAQPTGQSWD